MNFKLAKNGEVKHIIGKASSGTPCGTVKISGETMNDNQLREGVDGTIVNLYSSFGNLVWYLSSTPF